MHQTKTKLWKTLSKHCGRGNIKDIQWPEGWTDIVQRLHDDLVKICPKYYIFQIKEKYAELRYYTSTENLDDSQLNAFENRKTEAGLESRQTCMVCAVPGKQILIGSWTFTFCDACTEKYKAEREVEK